MFEEDETGVKKQRDSRDLELHNISKIMSTENGRSFMWRCLQNCSTFESIFSTDTQLHAFNAGARQHGVWLDAELREAATDDYFKMLKENR